MTSNIESKKRRIGLRRLTGTAFSTTTYLIVNLGLPLVALALLGAEDYGTFSAVYLVYGFCAIAVSVTMSESWLRAREQVEVRAHSLTTFLRALSSLSLFLCAFVGAVCLALSGNVPIAALSTAAAYFHLYRMGRRFRILADGNSHSVARGDILGAVSFGAAIVLVVLVFNETQYAIYTSWAASGAVSVIFGGGLSLPDFRQLSKWITKRRGDMVALAGDSLVLVIKDALLLIILFPLLGAASYGIYRAIGSVASPARTAILAIRPILARLAVTNLTGGRAIASTIAFGVLVGLIIGLSLKRIVSHDFLSGTALAGLAEFYIPVAIGVAVSPIATYWNSLARELSTARLLFCVRSIMSLMSLALTPASYIAFGIGGVLWCFSFLATLDALAWFFTCRAKISSSKIRAG